jgi:hypothetical protein
MRMAAATLAALAAAFACGWLASSASVDAPAAAASSSVPDPWASDRMSVLGTASVGGGAEVDAIHVPDYPLPMLCLVLVGPRGDAISCDADLTPPPAPGTAGAGAPE